MSPLLVGDTPHGNKCRERRASFVSGHSSAESPPVYDLPVLRRLRIENLVLIREADLELGAGLNAVTGETGAGKTIFAQAVGLLLGLKGDATAVGPAGSEAYVEAELDVPEGFFEDEELAVLAELRPADEPGLVLARRVFGDGRTRAYAWGRAVTREDLAAAAERLIAMSGQFEQRRLARPAYQLDVLDGFCGEAQQERRAAARAAWRALGAARRRHEELARDAGAAAARVAELRALVEDTDGFEPRGEDDLRARARAAPPCDRAAGGSAGGGAGARSRGGRRCRVARRDRGTCARASRSARPELAARRRGAARPDVAPAATSAATYTGLRRPWRPTRSGSRRSRPGSTRSPPRVAGFGARATRSCWNAATRLAPSSMRSPAGSIPVEAAAAEVEAARERYDALAAALQAARSEAADAFAAAVAHELRGIGMGEGEFVIELREREPGPTGRDEVAFLIRPNPGLPFGPVAETASGGELSRVALALAAVAGGETLVFDEIDAGIGGVTAHRVAETLARLAERAQVITITHLPQIARAAECHFRVEKVPGDPTHTQIEALADDERRASSSGCSAARRSWPRSQATRSRDPAWRLTSPAPLGSGRRTKDLVKRLRVGDVAIIDHADLDRVSAEELVASGRARGRQRRRRRARAVSRTRARSSSCVPA